MGDLDIRVHRANRSGYPQSLTESDLLQDVLSKTKTKREF